MTNKDVFFDNIKKKAWAIIKQIIVLMVYIFLILGLQYVFYKNIVSNNIYLVSSTLILIELIVLTIFIILFRKNLVPDFYDFKKNGNLYIKKYFQYWVIGFIIMIISNLIINSFLTLPTNEEYNRALLFKMPVYTILATIIFAPIIEECLTRIILKDDFRPIIYYTLSTIIFASLHLISASRIEELLYIIPYGALGFVFAYMYKKTNNIWTNIFFHSFHNTLAIILIFIGSI